MQRTIEKVTFIACLAGSAAAGGAAAQQSPAGPTEGCCSLES